MSDIISHDGPPGAPPKKDLPEAFREFLDGLNHANHLFETENDAGRKGIATACHAVTWFIMVTHQSPLLAAPLLALRAALLDREQGVRNPIIDLDDANGSRSRSSLKKHASAVAAVCLEVLVELGNPVDEAASRVARGVSLWRVMRGQEGVKGITQNTIKNWRNQFRGAATNERAAFDGMRNYLLSRDDADAEVDNLLRNGPPGMPKT